MDSKLFVCFLFLLVRSSIGKNSKYLGNTVYGVSIRNEHDIKLLQQLEYELDLDIWSHGMPGVRDADVMVGPIVQKQFVKALERQGIKYYVREKDVPRVLQKFNDEFNRWSRNRQNAEIYNKYPRFGEIDAYMERLAREYPNIVTVASAGLSFENRPMKYIKISTTNFEDNSKPIYFIDAAMHSREWITVPVALYIIHRLVEGQQDSERDLLENVDWIILPVYNPDGYEFSHTDDRMWRRSRSFNATVSLECYGADLNRNFDIFFNEINTSDNPCSNIYAGPYAFSEIENRNVRDLVLAYFDRIQIYMNIHSYGSYILYGFDNATLPNSVAQIHHVGATMSAHIDARKLPDAEFYLVGNSRFVLYAASGTAQDYFQHMGVPFSYTLELPEIRNTGFLFPPEYIPNVNTETWAGIAESARLSVLFYRDRRSG